ncbi:MAG: protein kinase [Phycisphaerales bacterium]|nr:protein kinase [Phycisphaerales bacterium]
MNSSRLHLVEQLFHRALELPCPERREFLNRQEGTDPGTLDAVRGLLDQVDADEAQPLEGERDDGPSYGRRWQGRQIGSFVILNILGRGSMGTVFEGTRGFPEQHAAIKVIRRSDVLGEREWETLLRRFHNEVGILGRLSHPGIAHFYESGTVDLGDGEQPYLAMELVRGVELRSYAAGARTSGRAAPLNMRGRIELIAHAADAVQHAHHKGIVHRDLKPANVLVDERAAVKVLDFGVARVLDPEAQAATRHTLDGQLVGTLAYMAPEQARGDLADVDTRSDVYALGAMLFELLSGRPPHDLTGLSFARCIHAICEVPAPRLRALNRSCSGDMDTIVAKALAAAPEERYASAGELAADLRRFLRHEPVVARPQTITRHLRCLVRRHRTSAAVAIAGALIALVLTLLAMAEGARARSAEHRLAARLEQMTQHLLRELESRSGTLELRARVAADVREDARGLLSRDPKNPRLLILAADAERQHSHVLHEQGRLPEALQCRREAFRLRQKAIEASIADPSQRRELAIDMVLIADVHFALGEAQEYRAWLERSEVVTRNLAAMWPTEEHQCEHAWSLQRLAAVELQSGNIEPAIERAEDSLAICGPILERDPAHASALGCARQTETYLGVLNDWRHEPQASLQHFTTALELGERLYQLDPRDREYSVGLMHALEGVADRLPRDEAKPLYERGYHLAQAQLAADPQHAYSLAYAQNFALRMGQAALDEGNREAAHRLALDAKRFVEASPKHNAQQIWGVASGFQGAAHLFECVQDAENAQACMDRFRSSCRDMLDQSVAPPEGLRGCAEMLLGLGAAEDCELALSLAARAVADSPQPTFHQLEVFAKAQLASGRGLEAIATLQRAIDVAPEEPTQAELKKRIDQVRKSLEAQ